jgi:hypothetical protein
MEVYYIVYRSDSFVWKCTTLCTGQITLCMEVYYIVYRSDSVVWKCTYIMLSDLYTI